MHLHRVMCVVPPLHQAHLGLATLQKTGRIENKLKLKSLQMDYGVDRFRPTINMEIPTAKYGKTTKNMEKIHVIMRAKIQ
jgi:hypothetical protein